MKFFFVVLEVLICLPVSLGGKPRWSFSRPGEDLFYMHYSERNPSGPHDNDYDDLMVWVGPGASGPRVMGKHGEMSLPAAWGAFVDVLFVDFARSQKLASSSECTGGQTKYLWDTLIQKFPNYKKVYFAGVWSLGGACVPDLSLEKPAGSFHEVGGAVLVDPPTTPTALFVSHGSLQSGNGELAFSANRAAQDIVCNSYLSEVLFIMDDVRLHYVRKHHNANSNDMEDGSYALKGAFVPGLGYFSAANFLLAMRKISGVEGMQKRGPYLPTLQNKTLLSECSSATSQIKHEQPVAELLKHPKGKVVLLATLRHNIRLTCSFYIGMFTSVAVEFRESFGAAATSTNSGSLDDLWPWGDDYAFGEFQEARVPKSSAPGSIVWVHANTAAPWSRRGALRLLALLKGDISEVDYYLEPQR